VYRGHQSAAQARSALPCRDASQRTGVVLGIPLMQCLSASVCQQPTPGGNGNAPRAFFGECVQINNLRPGRTYAFRVTPLPFSDAYLAIPPQPPSPAVSFSTVPTAPGQPHAPQLVARARNSLKVRALLVDPALTPFDWHLASLAALVLPAKNSQRTRLWVCIETCNEPGEQILGMAHLQQRHICGAPGLQFRWAEPEETGGRRVGLYRLDMFPPAGTAEDAAQTQVLSLACMS